MTMISTISTYMDAQKSLKNNKRFSFISIIFGSKLKSSEIKSEIGCFGPYPYFSKINMFARQRTKLVS